MRWMSIIITLTMTFIKPVGIISQLEKNMSNRFKIATIFLLQMQK